MKIKIPKRKVAIEAPILVLMCFAAQLPKAREPPALFKRATMIPSITKNAKIPALPETAEMKPSLTIESIV